MSNFRMRPYRRFFFLVTGAVVGVIALSVDVTDRMEAERALACKDEQLRQSQKMEAIGQLAGGIAHDFNNLLTAISGYTELARAELEPSGSASEMLFAVSKASDRAESPACRVNGPTASSRERSSSAAFSILFRTRPNCSTVFAKTSTPSNCSTVRWSHETRPAPRF